ncbi:hypothetical protein [Vibrio atypicus]|uniref:hypothetical protein n=1 Tax=Vibrio atypicus TaxID=558271 RepID=UPI00135C1DA7|nr:hypothetical protein [Vibrio atypicus]
MMNPLPPIEDKNQLDFPVTLGVFGMLAAFCTRQDQSVEQAHGLLVAAANRGRNFISLDKEQKPTGFVIWAKVPISRIEEIQAHGYKSESERLALLEASTDDGEPTILYMLSPFGQHLDVIRAWQATMEFENNTCWALADKGHACIRKLT